jgi:hypothetical protein
MSTKINLSLMSMGFAALSLTACAIPDGLEEENVGSVQHAKKAWNGLTANGLTANGLTANGLTANGLPLAALTTSAVSLNSTAMAELASSQYSRDVFSYIVSCALPATSAVNLTLNSTAYSFPGEIGLAPSWETGACNASCKSWVSACILARLNYTGGNVHVSLRGDISALATTGDERNDFSYPEATYYGDLFASAPVRYACTIGGSTLIERVCGAGSSLLSPAYTGCIVNVLGDCAAGTSPRCVGPDSGDGSFSACADPNSTTYPGSITVYRQL